MRSNQRLIPPLWNYSYSFSDSFIFWGDFMHNTEYIMMHSWWFIANLCVPCPWPQKWQESAIPCDRGRPSWRWNHFVKFSPSDGATMQPFGVILVGKVMQGIGRSFRSPGGSIQAFFSAPDWVSGIPFFFFDVSWWRFPVRWTSTCGLLHLTGFHHVFVHLTWNLTC